MSESSARRTMEADVLEGLTSKRKRLPPYLFYDDAGSKLYDRITELPEYYLTRTERAILEAYADEIVRLASDDGVPLRIVELGAGSATKTELLLMAALRRHGRVVYAPIDVSRSALDEARARLARDLPDVKVDSYCMSHAEALHEIPRARGSDLVLFIGSSVGNFADDEATSLLARFHDRLGAKTRLLLGTDLVKSREVLLRAYDDRAGVTAAFNKNILVHLNRELGATFDPSRFQHLAVWNAAASSVEMHLVSLVKHHVRIAALGVDVSFEERETIHTESSIKYDVPRVERLLAGAGFRIQRTFYDEERRFAAHLAA